MTTDTTENEKQITLYEAVGGAEKLRELVDRFYDLMELEPEYADIRKLHPTPMDGSRDKLFWFLSGWMGGPNLFIERFGHPRLRARHLPYPIASRERDQWLACMSQAMRELNFAPEFQAPLMESFTQTADWMRNAQDCPVQH